MSYTKNNQWLDPNAYKSVHWAYVRRFLGQYRPMRPFILAGAGLSLLLVAAAAVIPRVFLMAQQGISARDVPAVGVALLAFLGIMLFQDAVGYVVTRLRTAIYTRMNSEVLLTYYRNLLSAPVPDYLAFKRRSNLFQRLMDAMNVTGPFTDTLMRGTGAVVLLVGYGIVIGMLSPIALGVLVLGTAGHVVLVARLSRTLQAKRHVTLGINYPLVGKMMEVINGLLTIKALSASVAVTRDVDDLVRAKQRAEFDEVLTGAGVSVWTGALGHVVLLGAVAAAFASVLQSGAPVADVFAVYVLAQSFLGSTAQLGGYYQGLAMLSVNVKNYYEVLDMPDEGASGALPSPSGDGVAAGRPVLRVTAGAERAARAPDVVPASAPPAGRVAFDDVRFSYDGETDVLKGLSLDIQPGQRVALVGKSGVGKTTMLRLLLDFIQPRAGVVSVDGQNLREIADKNAYRRRFGIVSQDDFLFQISVRDNLNFGLAEPHADEALEEVLRAVDLLDEVRAYEDGLDTVYGDDQFSGGQRQRLLIARALARTPDVVLLDEPTSALDFENERSVLDAIGTLTEGKTSIIIAHRLTTVQSADRVVYVADGAVAADGSHAELYDTSDYYRELCDYNSFIL